MNHPRRQQLPPPKRNRENSFDFLKPSTKLAKPSPLRAASPRQPSSQSPRAKPPTPSNQLLAGYLAHEFLTKGSLFGKPWDPTRPEPSEPKGKAEASAAAEPREPERYVEVANLVKDGGVHLPGIVNPTQLARFMHM